MIDSNWSALFANTLNANTKSYMKSSSAEGMMCDNRVPFVQQLMVQNCLSEANLGHQQVRSIDLSENKHADPPSPDAHITTASFNLNSEGAGAAREPLKSRRERMPGKPPQK